MKSEKPELWRGFIVWELESAHSFFFSRERPISGARARFVKAPSCKALGASW